MFWIIFFYRALTEKKIDPRVQRFSMDSKFQIFHFLQSSVPIFFVWNSHPLSLHAVKGGKISTPPRNRLFGDQRWGWGVECPKKAFGAKKAYNEQKIIGALCARESLKWSNLLLIYVQFFLFTMFFNFSSMHAVSTRFSRLGLNSK